MRTWHPLLLFAALLLCPFNAHAGFFDDDDESTTEEPTTTPTPFDVTTSDSEQLSTTEEESGFGFFSTFFTAGDDKEEEETVESSTRSSFSSSDEKMSEKIRKVLQFYRLHKVIRIPNAPIPDPIDIPDYKKKTIPFTFTLYNASVHGMSNYSIDHINTNIEKMQAFVSVIMKHLTVVGHFKLKPLMMSERSGPLTLNLYDVEAFGATELKQNEDGTLYAAATEMGMTVDRIKGDYTGINDATVSNILDKTGVFVFEAVKKPIIDEFNDKIRVDINNRLASMGNKATDAPPLDIAVAYGREYVKEEGYDPYLIKNYSIDTGIVSANLTNFTLHGLSRFSRVGEIQLSMDKGNVQVGVHLATKDLHGGFFWKLGLTKDYYRDGSANYTVTHIQVKALVNQSVDVTQHPVLEKLKINVGKVKVNMYKRDTIDNLIAIAVNNMPDIVRHLIVDALEEPLSVKIQSLLDQINMEDIVDRGLPELDKMVV
jgi:hypothetical protein